MPSHLELERRAYKPPTPEVLTDVAALTFCPIAETSVTEEALLAAFPLTCNQPILRGERGEKGESRALRIGVVLSGGQASGGHNVIIALYDAMRAISEESQLFGFLGGPSGIVEGRSIELEGEQLEHYRNTGGFDLIGSGRTKIEGDEQLERALTVCSELRLDGLVIIGGDDSNTNAALLAEHFQRGGCHTRVIGVPKTIDGDLKNDYVELSFGFDTACTVYSELIGNLCRDALSAKKYYHFVRLMGRSASHIALECAMRTQPTYAIIGEEVSKNEKSLAQITKELADVIERRAQGGRTYGVILIPEGLIEFIPEMGRLIEELSSQEAPSVEALTPKARETFSFLPRDIGEQLLLDRDPHGNVRVSQIATEHLLIETVRAELNARGVSDFSPLPHFFGYEGRAAFPTNFDATYCSALGKTAVALIQSGRSGYMAFVGNLAAPANEWSVGGVPITSLMHFERRKGREKAVIAKALVDLDGEPFRTFAAKRREWMDGDAFLYPGPMQLSFDPDVSDIRPNYLKLI